MMAWGLATAKRRLAAAWFVCSEVVKCIIGRREVEAPRVPFESANHRGIEFNCEEHQRRPRRQSAQGQVRVTLQGSCVGR